MEDRTHAYLSLKSIETAPVFAYHGYMIIVE